MNTASDIVIRPIEPSDQHAACALILAGLGEHFPDLDPVYNPDLDDIWRVYVVQGHVFVVAEENGRLVGTGGLLVQATDGQLVRVSVARDRRGRGIGRAIVEHLVAAAQVQGLARVWMETNDDWHAAQALYRACGFHEFDYREGCIFMRRELDG
jgi:ribosomal protein S18 acetylase RimI-like enzyme